MRVGTLTKQPREEISVSLNYDEALDPKDAIQRIYGVEIEPPDEMRHYALLMPSRDRVRVFVNGGVNRQRYKLTVRVLTVGGEVLEDELTVKIKEI